MTKSPFIIASSEGEAFLIDGRARAKFLIQKIRQDVTELVEQGYATPGLAVILVGHDPASEVYVKNKAIQTHRAGMRSFMHMLPESTSQKEVLKLLDDLNHDDNVNGILVQLPLPSHLDETIITNAISPDKDVDGLGVVNTGRLALSMEDTIVPCTPLGCLDLLKQIYDDLTGLNALVIGVSSLVGRPMIQLLLQEKCTVTAAHIHTKNLDQICRQADIVVVATGKAELVRGAWIKKGAVVIDVGITRVQDDNEKTKLIGDVHFDEVKKVAGYVTPVPGGVGPMTISCLLKNTLKATRLQNQKKAVSS